MTTQVENYPSNALAATLSITYAVVAAELLDIGRIPRTFLHREYFVFEVIFISVLWLCTIGSMRLQAIFDQRSLAAFFSYGLLNGVFSGIVGSLALFVISIIERGTGSDVAYILSWRGAADFAWGSIAFSFGWLVGLLSGLVAFLFATRRRGWLAGIGLLCIIARGILVAVHAMHH